MNPPVTITIRSDNNKLQFVEEKKGIYTYKYVVSKTKLGNNIQFTESELLKLISNNQ